MQFCLIIAVLLWASVTETVSSVTLSTIPGPTQGSPSTSALPEDCPSTVDLFDIVFISAVPIAAGFGLLLLLAFLQDLRQVCKYKSKRSSPPSPCHIRGNRARKERAYVIDVDYAGCSRWGSFLRWCSLHKSPGANKNPRLVRLQEEAQEEAERKMIGLDHTNENNNNEVSTIEIRPCEEPTTRLPVSTNSDSAVPMDGIQSSSTLSTSDTDSLRNGIIISKDSANGKQDVSQVNQSLSEIKPTTSSKHCVRSCFSILAAFVQIFLIISCIFATLWSVSSFHGVCWHTLWEWVTTSIIAIVIQAVILDTLKAVVVTVMKRHSDKRATTSLVIPHPFSQ